MIAAPAGPGRELAERLAAAAQTALRLFGAAAQPEHLPPFVASAEWRALCRARTARIIHNNRLAAGALAARLRGFARLRCYHHGLFLTLAPYVAWDEAGARQRAEALAGSLQELGLPVRHAGSFGFDFAVVDAYPGIPGIRRNPGIPRAGSVGRLRAKQDSTPAGPPSRTVSSDAGWCGGDDWVLRIGFSDIPADLTRQIIDRVVDGIASCVAMPGRQPGPDARAAAPDRSRRAVPAGPVPG